jgi:hypothetical protein
VKTAFFSEVSTTMDIEAFIKLKRLRDELEALGIQRGSVQSYPNRSPRVVWREKGKQCSVAIQACQVEYYKERCDRWRQVELIDAELESMTRRANHVLELVGAAA